MNIITAVCRNHGIGKSNKLPWKKLSCDLRYFQKETIGEGNNAIIMGRKTWLSINEKPLPKRHNFILSRTLKEEEYPHENVSIYNNFYDLKKSLAYFDKTWVIGGEEIYKYFLNDKNIDIDKLYITNIDKSYDCDSFFPEIPKNYHLKFSSGRYTENDIHFNFEIYENAHHRILNEIPMMSF